MEYRDEVYFPGLPAEPEVPFSEAEFAERLQRIRTAMASGTKSTASSSPPRRACTT